MTQTRHRTPPTRREVMERLDKARNRGVAPSLMRDMCGADLHDLDFTSDFGVLGNEHFCGMYLGVDFRGAILRGSNFSRTDVSTIFIEVLGRNETMGTLNELSMIRERVLKDLNECASDLTPFERHY